MGRRAGDPAGGDGLEEPGGGDYVEFPGLSHAVTVQLPYAREIAVAFVEVPEREMGRVGEMTGAAFA